MRKSNGRHDSAIFGFVTDPTAVKALEELERAR